MDYMEIGYNNLTGNSSYDFQRRAIRVDQNQNHVWIHDNQVKDYYTNGSQVGYGLFIYNNESDFIIENNTFEESSLNVEGGNVTFRNNTVSATIQLINVYMVNTITSGIREGQNYDISKNKFTKIHSFNYYNITNAYISNNIFDNDISSLGITCNWATPSGDSPCLNITFTNNVLFNLTKGLIFSQKVGGTNNTVNISNNIFLNMTDVAITNTRQSNISSKYNLYFNNSTTNWAGYTNDGTGDLFVDPLFNDTSINDFHLKSQYGRWNGSARVNDTVTSPAIDAGDPTSDYSLEPTPNGNRINMGAYGNTAEASKSEEIVSTTPPVPVNLAQTNGSYWVNYTWEAGSGNVTDSYNISIVNNSVQYWVNGSSQNWTNSTIGANNWSNITVYAFNNSGSGNLNATGISMTTQVLAPDIVPTATASSSSSSTTEDSGVVMLYPNATTLLDFLSIPQEAFLPESIESSFRRFVSDLDAALRYDALFGDIYIGLNDDDKVVVVLGFVGVLFISSTGRRPI